MFLSTNYPIVYSICSVLELEPSVTHTQNVICFFCVSYNISLYDIRDFYIWSYIFKRSVYILYRGADKSNQEGNKLQ
jgi:hypothetical protein